jgi:hypothetical protein
MVGGLIGAIDGGTMPQTVGGQIGGISIVLEQMDCVAPLTHRQTHAALAGFDNMRWLAPTSSAKAVTTARSM